MATLAVQRGRSAGGWSTAGTTAWHSSYCRHLRRWNSRRYFVLCYSALSYMLQPNIGFSFGGVHAFGYNSVESEPMRMKSGAL